MESLKPERKLPIALRFETIFCEGAPKNLETIAPKPHSVAHQFKMKQSRKQDKERRHKDQNMVINN